MAKYQIRKSWSDVVGTWVWEAYDAAGVIVRGTWTTVNAEACEMKLKNGFLPSEVVKELEL